jgi:Lrp/AsnC family transcriptional regulator for asnA, asnC and gidA
MDSDAIDDLDRNIVAELQEDGRRPFREIARHLGVSERTIRNRTKHLQDAGILRILAFADPYKVGHSVLALVLLRVEALAHDQLVDAITAYPEVTYVSSLIGRADIYVQVICRDNEHLWELVNKRLRRLEGVIETETMMEMKVHKFIYHLLA